MRDTLTLATVAGPNRRCPGVVSVCRAATVAALFAALTATLLAAAPARNAVADEGRMQATPADLMSSSAPALSIVTPETTAALNETLAAGPLDLAAVRAGNLGVPRIYVTKLPADLRQVRVTNERKTAFIGSLLPLVLMANEEILEQRVELERLVSKQAAGEPLSLEEQGWKAALAEFYRVEPGDDAELLERVDALPVSLTLAQAIEESGWGTSRYAREGNALFGQRTWTQNVPGLTARKDGQTLDHRARAFADLMQSVRAYMHNLNTHNAYRKLRGERARLRAEGAEVEGAHLAGFLGSYAENETYVDNLRRLMRHNELAAYERAALAAGPATEALDEETAAEAAILEETLSETIAEAEQSAAAGASDADAPAAAAEEEPAPAVPAGGPTN